MNTARLIGFQSLCIGIAIIATAVYWPGEQYVLAMCGGALGGFGLYALTCGRYP